MVTYGVLQNIRSNANLRIGYGTLTWVYQPSAGGDPITVSGTLTNINNQLSYILRVPCETEVGTYTVSSNKVKLTSGGISFNRAQVWWNQTNLVAFAQPPLAATTIGVADRGRIERIDLNLDLPILDLDGNGIPDDWERSYFGRTGIDPFADSDRDGMNNLAEYLAGTDPTDALSVFKFVEIRSLPSSVQLKWLSAAGRTYALMRASAPSGPYADIATNIVSTPTTNSFVYAVATGSGPHFFRLRIEAGSVLVTPPFRITNIQGDPLGGVRLDWFSQSNKSYTLQRSTNLVTGFIDLQTGIVATPPTNTLREASATGPGPYFYRLRLEP